jgi:ATP-dependent DNA helicase RecQ
MGDLQYDRCSAELSIFAHHAFNNRSFKSLDFFCRRSELKAKSIPITPDIKLLNDITNKMLMRGEMTFPSYCIEKQIVDIYGPALELRLSENPDGQSRRNFEYNFPESLQEAYRLFKNFGDATAINPDKVCFDPEHPDNERRLYENLVNTFGPNINPYLYTQAPLDKILDKNANKFANQRADFAFAFPDGNVFVLEPGDHHVDPKQKMLDDMRDNAFKTDLKAKTHRLANNQIDDPNQMDQIKKQLEEIGAFAWMSSKKGNKHAEHLFLLPTLIARLEKTLTELLLFRGNIQKERISIVVVECDLCCAELAIYSFLNRIERLIDLYGLNLELPEIELAIYRNQAYDVCDLSALRTLLAKSYNCSISIASEQPQAMTCDIVLDVAIKSGSLLPTKTSVFSFGYGITVRNSFRHNETVSFSYSSLPKPISIQDQTEELLTGFLQDLFRKCALRPGQMPILESVLSQKPTIGLLPTSGGKSICYQLASVLTPGTTLIVDPIKMLMDDQAQGLKDPYRITRVEPWHSGIGPVTAEGAARMLQENLMIFLSPERFLRPNFRDAMAGAKVAGIYINYAVIDEAHCVSMWGHDFRPPYLVLERNIKNTCALGEHIPLTVALTGTASQLVLIDLKRELNIESMESIVRPDTFDRPELNFRVETCSEANKQITLTNVLATTANKLQVTDLEKEAWGIIFSYTPSELCGLLGKKVASPDAHANTVLNCKNWKELQQIPIGMIAGSKPKVLAGLNEEQWEKYKKRILFSFKRGSMRMLFGNAAVGVGIDSERLNYVINYRMPQSLESYYQMCGRAGRAGQPSECCLILSDDKPAETQAWLDSGTPHTAKDDINSIIYFHGTNFPDPDVLKKETFQVFKNIIEQLKDKKPAIQQKPLTPGKFDRTERYIGFLLMMGVLDDYTVTGAGPGTIYNLSANKLIQDYALDVETHRDAYRNHLFQHLRLYLQRYRPVPATQLMDRLNKAYPKGKTSERILGFLIDFIHGEIGKQRKEAVRTMLRFCTQPDTSSDQLRATIKAYFDRNPKFSDKLDSMVDSLPEISRVLEVLETVEDFNDAEHLYWETRRLLDERFRGDWALVNIYSMLYREECISDEVFRLLSETTQWFINEQKSTTDDILTFLAAYYSYLPKLDKIWDQELCMPMLNEFMQYHYKNNGIEYLSIIDRLELPPELDPDLLRVSIATTQIKELIDVAR